MTIFGRTLILLTFLRPLPKRPLPPPPPLPDCCCWRFAVEGFICHSSRCLLLLLLPLPLPLPLASTASGIESSSNSCFRRRPFFSLSPTPPLPLAFFLLSSAILFSRSVR